MKKFIINVIIFIFLIIILQNIYSLRFGGRILHLDSMLQNKTEIIYFGDSTLIAIDRLDQNTDSIPQYLENSLEGVSVGRISQGAYHLGIYQWYTQYIVRKGTKPKIIIFPINLRSFSPEWDLKPGYQFEDQRFLLEKSKWLRIYYRPLIIFDALDIQPFTQIDYLNAPVYLGKNEVGQVRDFDNITYSESVSEDKIRNKVLFHYLYNLDENHRKLQNLAEIIQISDREGLTVIFYITPVDYEICEKYFPHDCLVILEKNIQTIENVIIQKDTNFLNLALSLKSENFTYNDYPNEHLKEKGRRFVAKSLAEFILNDSDIVTRLSP